MRFLGSVLTRLLRLLFPLLAGLFAYAAGAQSSFPGSTAVGSSAQSQTVGVTVARAGTLDTVRVTTEGSAGFDFTNAGGGTCAAGANLNAGQVCTVQVGFAPAMPGRRHGAVTLLDRAGNTLGMTLLAGSATGSVAVFVPGTINTVAGSPAWIYSGDGGQAVASSIFLPFGLAVDAAGNLFIADSSNNRIRRVDAQTQAISTVAGTGVIGSNGDGGQATAAALSNPTYVALDPAGNLYIADSGNNVVRRVDAGTGIIATVVGTLRTHSYTGDGGPATAATLNTPNGIAFDAAGNLYIADTGNHAVRMVSAATGRIVTVAGRGFAGFAGDGGPATAALLSSPWSITPGPGGELYIADQNNNRIRIVSPTGVISTLLGTGAAGYLGDNGPASGAQLNVPASVVVDVAGNLYIADSGNNRVRKVNVQNGIITTVAGNLGESFSGDDGPADQAGLYGPYTLALDGQGSLYVADVFHNRIRKVYANQATLNFPPMRVGRVAAPIAQTLENDGNAPLNLVNIAPVKDAQVDATGTNCSGSVPLSPLATCVLSAAFAPTSTGPRVKGAIKVDSDAGNSPGVLTLAGQVLDIDPPTITLASTPNPSTAGQTVAFTVNVTSMGATPTGTVVLYDGTSEVTRNSLSNGTTAFAVRTLTGGQHSMTANYLGDSATASGTSSPLIQVVKDVQAATATALTSSASPIDAGATLRLTATVTPQVAGAGNGIIAGTVVFKEGATTLGSAQIAGGSAASGSATLSLTTLPVGTHSITAVYAGTATYAASTSSAYVQVVNLASTQTALTTDANPSHSGARVAMTATVTSTGGVPTGPVAFTDGTTTLGTAPLDAQGKATLMMQGQGATVGTHMLRASYAGDTANGPSSATPMAQAIDLATTTTTLVSSLNPSASGAQVTFTATVAGNGGTPAGTVQFLDGAKPLGTATLDAAGVASLPVSTLAVATHTITASYTGDALDGGSTSSPLDQVVTAATVTVTLSPSNDPAIVGAAVVFTIQVNGTGAALGGQVTLLDGAQALGTATLDPSGAASISLSTLALGQHPMSAAYAGDAYHPAANSATIVETIQQYTTVSLVSSAPHVVAGVPVTFSMAVVGSAGSPTPGTLQLKDGAQVLATLTVDAQGHASYTTSTLAVGQHTLTAAYAGDPLSAASSATSLLESVDIATTTTSLASSLNPAFAGAPVTLTAQVGGNGAMPTGQVTFHDGAGTLGTGTLNAAGTTTLTLSTLAPGVHTLTAAYEGDPADQPSTSAALSEQVYEKTTVTLVSSANPALLTDPVTIGISVANGVAGSVPSGTVTLRDGGAVLTTLALDPTGRASYTLVAPALGTHSLVASYAGDPQNVAADSATLNEVVTLRPTSVSLTASSTALSAGQQLILVSVLKSSGPSAPTGSIRFVSGSTVLGTAPVDAAGVATLTLTSAQAGLNVVAQYPGDTLYAASVSPVVAIVVGPPVAFQLTLTPPTMSVASGQHGSVKIDVATATTFTDTLAFGCAGLPQSATCTFSSATMPVAGGIAHSLTVTVDTGNPLGAGARVAQNRLPLDWHSGAGAAAACGLLLLSQCRRRLPVRLLVAVMALGATLSTLAGCGSSFNQNPTPAGSYSFQIVATGQKTAATESATMQLTVTK